MPKFTYTAKINPHKIIQGDIEAESKQDAVNKLINMQYFPIVVQAEHIALGKNDTRRLRKTLNRDAVIFTRQLATLTESGVNILNSLNIISSQTPSKYLKAIYSDIADKIKGGKSLSESLGTHPALFSNLYISMIHSGEVSGTLESALKRLADFLEKQEEFKNSIRAALVYPAFIFAVGTLTVIILLGFVIPRLVNMFEDMEQILPLPTAILINASGILRNYWWLIILVVFTFVFLWQRLHRSLQGKVWLDGLKLKLPVIKKIVLETEISRLMRTLSLLLSSGMAIIPSLDISTSVLENQILKFEMQKFKDQIAGGLSLSQSLGESKLFPIFVTNIIAVGEESGNLEKSLMRIADDYERQVDRILKNLSRLLEPVMILAMGLIVGFIVLSMLLPIFQINLIVR